MIHTVTYPRMQRAFIGDLMLVPVHAYELWIPVFRTSNMKKIWEMKYRHPVETK